MAVNPPSSSIHRPILIAAAIFGLLFVGVIIGVLLFTPRPAPVVVVVETAPAPTPPPAPVPEESIEISIPTHRPAEVVVPPRPAIEPRDIAPEPPIQPIVPKRRRDDIVPVRVEKEKDGSFGTGITFVPTPREAFRTAKEEKRLVFMLHFSGEVKDNTFTAVNVESLRSRALADDDVGKYLNREFVSAFQKVSSARTGNERRDAGNVAAYFCQPSGRVLHAVAGPVDAETLLNEAKWTVDMHNRATQESAENPNRYYLMVRQAHLQALQKEMGGGNMNGPGGPFVGPAFNVNPAFFPRPPSNSARLHMLFVQQPLPSLGVVYKPVFMQILGEMIATLPADRLGP